MKLFEYFVQKNNNRFLMDHGYSDNWFYILFCHLPQAVWSALFWLTGK